MIKKLITLVLLMLVGVAIYYTWVTVLAGDNVKLYFATKDGMALKIEERKIKGDIIKGSLEALIAGPTKPGLVATIPEGVKVLNINITEKLCVVNFNEKLVTNHWGGSTGELLTIYSIVNTLTQFSNIDQVQILIEGQKIETLAGHMILDESLKANKELVQ